MARKGGTGDEHQCGGEAVADASFVARIGDVLEAFDQVLEVSRVEVDQCRLAPWISRHERMVERAAKHFDAPSVQRTDVDIFDLAVGDIATGPAPGGDS
jgi:hypothetical protein